jgi:hypothetical protein
MTHDSDLGRFGGGFYLLSSIRGGLLQQDLLHGRKGKIMVETI